MHHGLASLGKRNRDSAQVDVLKLAQRRHNMSAQGAHAGGEIQAGLRFLTLPTNPRCLNAWLRFWLEHGASTPLPSQRDWRAESAKLPAHQVRRNTAN